MGITGDFAELDRLASSMNTLASEAPTRLSEGMTSAYNAFMQSTVGSGMSPEGSSWTPLRNGQQATLGSIAQAACNAISTGSGFTVDIPDSKHPEVHQNGAVITAKGKRPLAFRGYSGMIYARSVTIPARPFRLTSIPSDLEAAFDASGEAILSEIIG